MHDPSLPFPGPEPVPSLSPRSGPAQDAVYGEIRIRLDAEDGTLTVEGEEIPLAELRRLAGAKVNEHVPIGTRDADRLVLTVAGEDARITPARGRISRRSYRVDVAYGGAAYRLVPCSPADSKLLKDRRRIGVLTSRGDGSAEAEWKRGGKVLPQDAAIGYALAAAFGTGAQSTLDWLLDPVDALLSH
ncbi:hypothetical protein [Streptomyces sp. SD15]